MWLDYLIDFASDPLKVSVALAGWSLAASALLWARRAQDPNRKLRLLGLHIALLFFPLVFAALAWDCGMLMAECLPMSSAALLPLAFGLLFWSGYRALPWAYRWAHRRHRIEDPRLVGFAERSARRLGVPTPRLHYLDTAHPTAHTFTGRRPFVFLSVGLLDILDRRETEAVLLHELGHIRDRASLRGYASRLLPWTAPALAFGGGRGPEEDRADLVAVELQGTRRHLETARAKVRGALREFQAHPMSI